MRDVADPDPVDGKRRLGVGEQVGTIAERVSAIGRLGAKGTGLNRYQTEPFHEPGDAYRSARFALCREFLGDPPGAVASPVFPEDALDQREQPEVFAQARSGVAFSALVIAAAIDAERFTGVGDGDAFDLKFGNDRM